MKKALPFLVFLLFVFASISTNAQCANGNQTTSGNGSWIGYAYTYSGTPAPTSYIGYVTELESFNRNLGTGAISGATSALCSAPIDNFYVAYKMTKTFQPGSYTFTVGGDDGYRLKIATESTYMIDGWNDHSYVTSSATKVFNTTTTVDFTLEYYEKGGSAQVSFAYVCNAAGPPTSISGTTSICAGESTTLTAVGGTAPPYEWGTGNTVGSNVISGQNNATITVSPTSTTTYWVRSLSSCRTASTGATATVTFNTITGNPSVYGVNSWNIYGYNTTANPMLANYRGYYVQNTLNADTQDTANNGWLNSKSPASSSGWIGCTLPDDNFVFVHKRKGFPCGKYELIMDNWDDNTQVLINGISILDFTGWSGNYATPYSGGMVALDENSTIDIITKEFTGSANMKIRLVATNAVYNGSAWSVPPDGANIIVNSGNVDLTANTNICSCTLTGTSNVTIKDGYTLIVKDFVSVASTASFTVENNASLVQINDNAANVGTINVKRNTAPVKRYDFTYWSSPVGSFTLYNLSPNTLGDKFYSYDPILGWTIHYNGNQQMLAGKGYLVRAPQNYDINTAAIYSATFIGKPNNGIIQAAVGNASNLIGNPYPSAISADAIYNANSDKINGTFYFWTHNSSPNSTNPGSGTYNYTADDYASYNSIGGVKTKPATYGGAAPTGNIGSGQSFFIGGKINGNITFSNSMRVTTANGNSQFFRNSNTTQSENLPVTIEKHRLWLNISNEAGEFNETLIGYATNATNEMDDAFDGANLSSGNATLYSIIGDNNLVIQGRALPFTNTDVVRLGIKISTAGQYTINMDQFDGLFSNQNIYLYDTTTSTYHDLKSGDFIFNSEAGTFNARFEIRYINEALGINTPIISQNDVVVYKSGNQIAVRATNLTIDTVQVYDITGKLLTSGKNINNSEFKSTGLNTATQVVIVKVNFDNNQTVSKKVILN